MPLSEASKRGSRGRKKKSKHYGPDLWRHIVYKVCDHKPWQWPSLGKTVNQPKSIPKILSTNSPFGARNSKKLSSSSASSPASTFREPCWTKAALVDSASKVCLQRCGACPPVRTSYQNLRQLYHTQKQLVAHEGVYTVLEALRKQFEVEIGDYTLRKKTNSGNEQPQISLNNRPHLIMTIPRPHDGKAKKNIPVEKPRPPPLVTEIPLICEQHVAHRSRIWLDIMRSGSVVIMWPISSTDDYVQRRKRSLCLNRALPILLGQCYGGGVRIRIEKKKMVGLTYIVCSCGHHIARDYPGTEWAITPVTSLLSLNRMYKTVASEPKKLPFSRLLIGQPKATHLIFSDSESSDATSFSDDDEDIEDKESNRHRIIDSKNCKHVDEIKATNDVKGSDSIIDLTTEADDDLCHIDLCSAAGVSSSTKDTGDVASLLQQSKQDVSMEMKMSAPLIPQNSLPPSSSSSSSSISSLQTTSSLATSHERKPHFQHSISIDSPYEASICKTLNPSQRKAIDLCVSLSKSGPRPSPLVLLQGPPGTGKTHTCVRLLQILQNRGMCVAVCASTNKAVSVIMEGFLKEALKRKNNKSDFVNAYLVGVEDQVEPHLREYFIHDQPALLRSRIEQVLYAVKRMLLWFDKAMERRSENTIINIKAEYPGCHSILALLDKDLRRVHDVLHVMDSWWEFQNSDTEPDPFYLLEYIHSFDESIKSGSLEKSPEEIKQDTECLLGKCSFEFCESDTDAKTTAGAKDSVESVETLLCNQMRMALSLFVQIVDNYKLYVHERAKDSDVERALLNRAQFVFCTLCISGRGSMSPRSLRGFDVLIVDEAAQPIEAELLIATSLRPKQLILIGDPCQLSSTVQSQEARRSGFDGSLMARLIKIAKESDSMSFHMLDTQYRMDPLIAQWPSDTFYESKLKNGACVALLEKQRKNHFLTDKLGALAFIDCENGLEERAQRSGSLFNLAEAETVVHIISLLTRSHYNSTRSLTANQNMPIIRVLTFYRAQVAEIRRKLHRLANSNYGHATSQVRVDTVDSMQGSEADIVILSFVRTSRRCGFLADSRRLNVALTRAKQCLILVGRRSALEESDSSHVKSCLASIKDRHLVRSIPIMSNSMNQRPSIPIQRHDPRARHRHADRSQNNDIFLSKHSRKRYNDNEVKPDRQHTSHKFSARRIATSSQIDRRNPDRRHGYPRKRHDRGDRYGHKRRRRHK